MVMSSDMGWLSLQSCFMSLNAVTPTCVCMLHQYPNCDSWNCVVICGDFAQLLPTYVYHYFPHTFTDS